MGELCSRFATDTHTAPVLLERILSEDDDVTARDLFARLALLYRIWCPVKKAATHGA